MFRLPPRKDFISLTVHFLAGLVVWAKYTYKLLLHI